MHKFLMVFLSALLVAGVGIVVGQFVPEVLMLPLYLVELGLLVAVSFARKRGVSYAIMYLFMFISGIVVYSSISYYVEFLGNTTVLATFFGVLFVFCMIATYGSLTRYNFSFLGNALFFILIALIVIAILGVFVPFPSTIELLISIVGILLFSAYTLYDFNRIAKYGMYEDEIPIFVLNIYLDFINLFLYTLKLISSLRE